MALTVGTRFGDFDITGTLGAGGMGEVYRATDTTLDREVAIKVLPQSLVDDTDRIARFDREAKTLAMLNHANIAQVYGLAKADTTTAIIMELVEGQTLDERIAEGPLPVDEAMDIALQIAAALEAAHSQHIVHRDLKPQNIKLKADGTVKVLDFGIAKALEPEILRTEPPSPMLTTPATQVGVILGTAAYMSPEQARGLPVDQRADIWAFGCLLYEMLTGQLAFGAEDAPTTLARVIANEADLDALPASVSPAVRRTIELCLQKDPRERLHNIADARLALTGAFLPAVLQGADGRSGDRLHWRRVLPFAAVALAAGLAIGFFYANSRPEPGAAPLPVNRFEVNLPAETSLSAAANALRVLALSPDGRQLVVHTSTGLYLRNLGELDGRLLPGTDNATLPTFSPDGRQLAFYSESESQMMRIELDTDRLVAIAPPRSFVSEISWETDDDIIYNDFRVPADGGTPAPFLEPQDGEQIREARQLPGGEFVLFRSVTSGSNSAAGNRERIVVASISTGERKILVEDGISARYVPTGHLVFIRGNALYAVAFDLERLEVTGEAVPLVQGVTRGSFNFSSANYQVSGNGTLAYVTGDLGQLVNPPVWLDRDGNEQAIAIEPGLYVDPSISPDGRRLALVSRSGGGIWVWDFGTETRSSLTPNVNAFFPVWTADSRSVAYHTANNDLELRAANNSGPAENIAPGLKVMSPYFFSPAGDAVVYRERGNAGPNSNNIVMAALGGDSEPVGLLRDPHNKRNPALAPGGHWMAYQSDETGRFEIYVRPFPNVEYDRYQLTTAGGVMPRWSQDGKELFYLEPGSPHRLMSVSVEATETSFSFGVRESILDWPYPVTQVNRQYDVSPDGQRFLGLKERMVGASPRIVIVQNWFEELKRQVPVQ